MSAWIISVASWRYPNAGFAVCLASIDPLGGGVHGANRMKAADMIALARQYGRYVYRRIAALLRDAGWLVNDKLVERLWRR